MDELISGAVHDPHAVLGAHPTGSETVIRTLRRGADDVAVLVDGQRHAMKRVHDAGVFEAMSYAVLLNFVLAIFNLVPAPPLDGGTVLAGVLPERLQPAYQRFSQYGIFILFAFIAEQREKTLRSAFRQAGVDALELSTDDNLIDSILRFADLRKRRSQLAGGATLPSHLEPTHGLPVA